MGPSGPRLQCMEGAIAMNLDALTAQKELLQHIVRDLKHKLVLVDLQIENELERMAAEERQNKKGLAF